MHRISLNTAARVLNIHVLFCLKVREACIFCVFKSLQLFCFKSDFRKKINYTKNKHNFAACQNGAVVARGGHRWGGVCCVLCDDVARLPICFHFFHIWDFRVNRYNCIILLLFFKSFAFQNYCPYLKVA